MLSNHPIYTLPSILVIIFAQERSPASHGVSDGRIQHMCLWEIGGLQEVYTDPNVTNVISSCTVVYLQWFLGSMFVLIVFLCLIYIPPPKKDLFLHYNIVSFHDHWFLIKLVLLLSGLPATRFGRLVPTFLS